MILRLEYIYFLLTALVLSILPCATCIYYLCSYYCPDDDFLFQFITVLVPLDNVPRQWTMTGTPLFGPRQQTDRPKLVLSKQDWHPLGFSDTPRLVPRLDTACRLVLKQQDSHPLVLSTAPIDFASRKSTDTPYRLFPRQPLNVSISTQTNISKPALGHFKGQFIHLRLNSLISSYKLLIISNITSIENVSVMQ